MMIVPSTKKADNSSGQECKNLIEILEFRNEFCICRWKRFNSEDAMTILGIGKRQELYNILIKEKWRRCEC